MVLLSWQPTTKCSCRESCRDEDRDRMGVINISIFGMIGVLVAAKHQEPTTLSLVHACHPPFESMPFVTPSQAHGYMQLLSSQRLAELSNRANASRHNLQCTCNCMHYFKQAHCHGAVHQYYFKQAHCYDAVHQYYFKQAHCHDAVHQYYFKQAHCPRLFFFAKFGHLTRWQPKVSIGLDRQGNLNFQILSSRFRCGFRSI